MYFMLCVPLYDKAGHPCVFICLSVMGGGNSYLLAYAIQLNCYLLTAGCCHCYTTEMCNVITNKAPHDFLALERKASGDKIH